MSDTESFEIFGITEKYQNKEQEQNGDHILYRVIPEEDLVVALLADGVSNSPCDFLSSKTACETFMQDFLVASKSDLEERILHAMREAHYAVLNHAAHHGMLCAFAAVVWRIGEDDFYFINIGDTRIYKVSGETSEQITEDEADTVFLRRGSKIATDGSGQILTRRVITNAVGSKMCRITVRKGVWQEGELIILASDGFYNIYEIIDEVRIKISENKTLSTALSKVWVNNMEGFEDDNSIIVLRS